jgi:hypothetical protein
MHCFVVTQMRWGTTMETIQEIQERYKKIRAKMDPTPKAINRALEFRVKIEPKLERPKRTIFSPGPSINVKASFPDLTSIQRKEFDISTIKFQDIMRWVCIRSGYSKVEICSQRRTNDLCHNRQLIWQIAKKVTGMSLPQMGKLTGDRDHTTVLHGIRKTPDNIDKIIAEMMHDLSGGSYNVDTKTQEAAG